MKKTIFLFLFILINLCGANNSTGKESGNILLQKGDSLFTKKKYIEAGELYEKAFTTYRFFTPQMLLKLAFINEGLHNNSSALYYLAFYRKNFPDLSVEEKIVKLAGEKSISGYSSNYYTTLRNTYFNFYQELIYVLSGIAILWFLRMIYLFLTKKQITFLHSAFFMTFLIISGLIVNYDRFFKSEAIIFEQQPLVMNAPSSGASLIAKPEKGTKVFVLQREDIWSEILFDNRKGFIRSKALREI